MNAIDLFRPRWHFAPSAGWINDPNGLIFADGRWHLFFQHDPDSTDQGPMHWGHASSLDLLHWSEHPIALLPDELGTCFSGSAIETDAGEMKLFYTAHRVTPAGVDYQVQCLVHADRKLTQFESDSSNPIIVNPNLEVFRDPKVFWHSQSGRWVMLLTHGQSIGFHSSEDLLNWRLESTFGEGHGRHGVGPWECPDLIALQTPEGETQWVLIVGIGSDCDAGGSGTQYFVGDFDGRHFVNANPPEVTLWADAGRDYYAAQSFFGSEKATTIAWASNWQYARNTPTSGFRGVMTLPRQLGLVATSQGIRLSQVLPDEVAAAFSLSEFGCPPTSASYRLSVRLGAEANLGIALFGATEPQFVLARGGNGQISVRSRRDPIPGLPEFGHNYIIELPRDASPELEIYVDNGIVEMNFGEGRVWMTNLFYPSDPCGVPRLIEDVTAEHSAVECRAAFL